MNAIEQTHAAEAFSIQPAPDYNALFERFMAKLRAKFYPGLVWEYGSHLKFKCVRGTVVHLTVPTIFSKHRLMNEDTVPTLLAYWQEDIPEVTKVEIELRSAAVARPPKPATPALTSAPMSTSVKIVVRQQGTTPTPTKKAGDAKSAPDVPVITPEARRLLVEVVGQIKTVVASFYNISVTDLICNWLSPLVVNYRQVSIFLTKEMTPFTFAEIGEMFDRLDHVLVRESYIAVLEREDQDAAFAKDLRELRYALLNQDAEAKKSDELSLEKPPKRLKIEDIQRVVARHFNMTGFELISSRRTRVVVKPRQIAMYLAKTLTPRSFPEIGRRFGGRDHTTVLHAVRKIEELLLTDKKLQELVDLLRGQLLPNDNPAPKDAAAIEGVIPS